MDEVHFEKTLSSEVIFQGKVVTLTKDIALLENGRQAVREVVHHNGGACILPYFADGTICMVRQFRYAMQQELWELPAGKLSKRGGPLCRRPAGAGGGMWPDRRPLYLAGEEFYPRSRLRRRGDVHLGSRGPARKPDAPGCPDEFLTPDRVPLEQAYQRVMSGEIRDGKTVAGILKLKALLAEGKL